MTKRFIVTLPGLEQEFEVGIPTLDSEDIVLRIVTRESTFDRNTVQVIINCMTENAGEDNIQMNEVTIEDRQNSYECGFDFLTDDIGMVHVDVEFVGRKTWVTVSF